MTEHDFLFEIGCGELPAKTLLSLSEAIGEQITQQLQQAELCFKTRHIFATPRRIAILITGLISEQPSQFFERQGPSAETAFDKNGTPTLACIGFARSCGVSADQLEIKQTDKGKRMVCKIQKNGKKTLELLPDIIDTAFKKLPLNKPMRWGHGENAFTRPVQWLLALYHNTLVPIELFGIKASNRTYGHRFHHPNRITVTEAQHYEKILKNPGMVIADYHKRRKLILDQMTKQALPFGHVLIDEKLLDEVTALVEWPVVLVGQFRQTFLKMPEDVLITSMKVHQKCFPILTAAGKLSAHFIIVSNIESKHPQTVINGNERVINARLADAAFFYKNDLNHPLSYFVDRLTTVVFQKQLGSLFERTKRLIQLNKHLATLLHLDITQAIRAAELSKFDLMTEMVGEFPELQGIMGFYYAQQAKENDQVSMALKEHYLPRFSGGPLPTTKLGAVLGLADRLDLLVGILGVNLTPSSEKDPYALRRAAIGAIRMIIEWKLPLDLMALLEFSYKNYSTLPNKRVVTESFEFIIERMRSWYLEKGVSTEIFSAVAASASTQLYDFDQRLKAVEQFQSLPESTALAAANKRVNNILKKSLEQQKTLVINPSLFESESERQLATLIQQKTREVDAFYKAKNYTQALSTLAALKAPVDHFFDHVMILVEDPKIRENRIALLNELHHLFTQVADLSLL